jgi:hypothetical protein
VVALETTKLKDLLEIYIETHYEDELFMEMDMLHAVDAAKSIELPDIEPFSSYLFALMDEGGFEDVSFYKKAQVDRKLFSKIRSNVTYQPSKKTVFKCLLALELDYQKAKEFLEHAGFAFSRSSKLDLIVEFAVKQKEYNIDQVNTWLYDTIKETL